MATNNKKIGNPLTMISIFSGIVEILAGTLTLVDKSLQPILIWFLVGFPALLVILFFVTLNFNRNVLYAPSDFRNEDYYMRTIKGFDLKTEKSKNDEHMTIVKNKKMIGEEIDIDGKLFEECEFINCIFRYSADNEFGLVNNKITNPRWVLAGHAANTMQFLSQIYMIDGDYGKNTIETLFEKIRRNDNYSK